MADTVPSVCGASEVTGPKEPSGRTVVVPVLPSGKVTVAMAPGSPVPETESVPSRVCSMAPRTGACGPTSSEKGTVAVGETLPAPSVWVAVTSPEVCGDEEVIGPKVPSGPTTAAPIVPSGKRTVAVDPGSPVPDTDKVPSSFGVGVSMVGAVGAVVSV